MELLLERNLGCSNLVFPGSSPWLLRTSKGDNLSGNFNYLRFETHHAAFRLSAKAEETEAAPVATEAVAADLAEALAAAERGEASSSRPAAAARKRGQGFTEESVMCVYWLNFNAFGIVGLSTSRPKRSSSGCKKKHYKHVFYWRNFTEEVLLEKLDWRCV